MIDVGIGRIALSELEVSLYVLGKDHYVQYCR
jgi:hypothetical protein